MYSNGKNNKKKKKDGDERETSINPRIVPY